jgi:Zn-dependent peptidase ImmA (M78 family)
MPRTQEFWTNPSVRQFSRGNDPVTAIAEHARRVALDAIDDGWNGPPFDPIELAERLGLQVVPRDDLPDARTVAIGSRNARIEFNPTRPRGRLRYSIAHEIAHTFFADWAEAVRNRLPQESGSDNWQLELLCNVAAAELLMPIGTLEEVRQEPVSVERLMTLRKKYDVSTEAMFIRVVRLTEQPCMIFAAARTEDTANAPYRIDYAMPSRTWRRRLPSGTLIEATSVLSECTAVGYTATGCEKWDELPLNQVECVGIPPYPGSRYPRVVGLLSPRTAAREETPTLRVVRGDATQPRGEGRRILAHIVNDRTPNWGAGFALKVRKTWRSVQEDFQRWVATDQNRLCLGNTHVSRVDDSLSVFHMIAQRGYGPSVRPRIRYAALRSCLDQLAQLASEERASVHLPRIGTGQARGNWHLIEALIDDSLLSRGIQVTVYDLPATESPVTEQPLLGLVL